MWVSTLQPSFPQAILRKNHRYIFISHYIRITIINHNVKSIRLYIPDKVKNPSLHETRIVYYACIMNVPIFSFKQYIYPNSDWNFKNT